MSGRASGALPATMRSATAHLGVLLLRRARVDLALLVVLAVVLVLASAAAALAPRVLTGVLDAGAKDAVTRAGSAADLLVEAPVGRPRQGVAVITPQDALRLTSSVPAGLGSPLRRLTGAPTGVVLGPPVSAVSSHGGDLVLRVGAVGDGVRLRTTSGRLPSEAAGGRIEVVVGRAVAATASISVGDDLRFSGDSGRPVVLHVVGLVAPANAAARRLPEDLPGLWKASPVLASGGAAGFEVDVLTSPVGALATADRSGGDPWVGRVRVPFHGSRFAAAVVPRVADAIETLAYSSSALGDVPADLRVASGFQPALAAFEQAEDTASAQLALALTGALAVAVAAVVLLMRLLVRRRGPVLLLERSRGASVPTIVIGALVESAAVAAAAAAAGLGLAALVLGGRGPGDARSAAVVAAVAVVTEVVLTTVAAAGALRPAARGRPERSRVRPVAEGTAALLAVGAVLAVRARGLQPSQGGFDPLLVAAPVLVAVAAALLAIRVHPVVVRGAARLAARGRGALGIVATAHAERSLSALPLAVLALSVGVAVGGVLLTDAVHRGQADASWQTVGADVHLTGSVPSDRLPAGRLGVTAAAAIRSEDLVELDGGGGTALVTMLAVDARYPGLLARLPEGLIATERRALVRLDAADASGGTVPALVSVELRDRVRGGPVRLRLPRGTVTLRVVGVLDAHPGGVGDPPLVTVSRAALAAVTGTGEEPTDLLATGPGAGRAAAALASPRVQVLTRTGWLAEQQGRPLVAEVVAGAPRRRRIAALLATIGVRGRVPRLLLLAEVGPVALGALLAGLAAGGVVAFALGPVLGLGALTGGAVAPPAFSPVVLLVALLGVVPAVLLAVVAESAGAHRLRLAPTLRSGDVS
jgi:putative ABC transport system permease protein